VLKSLDSLLHRFLSKFKKVSKQPLFPSTTKMLTLTRTHREGHGAAAMDPYDELHERPAGQAALLRRRG
jgi:hypothetical protein